MHRNTHSSAYTTECCGKLLAHGSPEEGPHRVMVRVVKSSCGQTDLVLVRSCLVKPRTPCPPPESPNS
eukprot:6250607-Amphidinium_carterae.1